MADHQKPIPMSMTDTFPQAPHRSVKASRIAWASSQTSILEAQNELANWVDRNGFDAVIGLRLVAKPGVRVIDWVIYGTAITWDS
jgi:hypothetical protein